MHRKNYYFTLKSYTHKMQRSIFLGLRRGTSQPSIRSFTPCALSSTQLSMHTKHMYSTPSEDRKPSTPTKNLGFIPRGAPSCEWTHIHDTDASQGKILRTYYHNGAVHFHYLPQVKTREELRASEKPREDGSQPNAPSYLLCDRTKRVVLILPTPFICRLLAVLEGTVQSTELATRNTQGTFSGDYQTYNFELNCTTVLPDGTSMPWKVNFKPGESIVLQRFLSLSLERNFGFTTYTDQPPRQQNKRK